MSLIIDDSTVLVNLNYFFLRDRNIATGENRRWEDVPVVHPESFTREWAEWCGENGVRGKFSVVPCPGAVGRVDQGLPLFSRAQQESWLRMCRELLAPNFDITPEMMTHTFVVDLDTFQPVEGRPWEQYDWEALPTDQEDRVHAYIAAACQILCNVDLPPQGVTSPGGFGGRTLEFYARVAGEAVRGVTGNPTPFFFNRFANGPVVETPVWFPDRDAGTAVGEIIASTGDYTGSWTGYGGVDPNYYITGDLEGGRLPALIRAGEPAVLCSHWQGLYGMHNDDRRGFNTLKTVVHRLRRLDPNGERARWRTCSEITNYACMRELAEVHVEGDTVRLNLPVQAPETTLRVRQASPAEVLVNGRPLRRVHTRASFTSGTWFVEEDTESVLAAFDPDDAVVRVVCLQAP